MILFKMYIYVSIQLLRFLAKHFSKYDIGKAAIWLLVGESYEVDNKSVDCIHDN